MGNGVVSHFIDVALIIVLKKVKMLCKLLRVAIYYDTSRLKFKLLAGFLIIEAVEFIATA